MATYLGELDDPGGELAPIRAQHFLDAIDASPDSGPDLPELLRMAVKQLKRAAQRASVLGAPGEALRYLEAAIERLDTDSDLAALHVQAANAASDVGDGDAAVRHADRASAREAAARVYRSLGADTWLAELPGSPARVPVARD